MKILYDHLCFWERYGGVSRYFVELIKRLPPENIKLLLKITNNEYINELSRYKTYKFLQQTNFKGKAKLISEIGKLISIPELIKGDFDIYHPTHYDCYGFKYLPKRVKTIATIHDLNYFKIPQFYRPNSRNKQNQEKIIHKVDHIITISKKTKEDLQELFGLSNDRISVIYHGIDNTWIKNAPIIPYNNPYFLFVGRRSAYKNFVNVLKAMKIISKSEKDLKLYCAGLPPSPQERNLINQLQLKNKIVFISATSDQLANLYKQALGFIFPSFYEGFGLPILEAMSAGCPTIISNASCFPEIASNASIYFNPNDHEELADRMINLLNNSDLRQKLIINGHERVSHFSWDKSAEEHLKVYKSIL